MRGGQNGEKGVLRTLDGEDNKFQLIKIKEQGDKVPEKTD